MSIKHNETKIKSEQQSVAKHRLVESLGEYFIPLIIVFVAFASFGLGRLSATETAQKQPIFFEDSHLQTSANALESVKEESTKLATVQESGKIVASKNGTKYHFPWCSGAQRIKEENKLWFASTEEARRAGLTPASNCKGLQ